MRLQDFLGREGSLDFRIPELVARLSIAVASQILSETPREDQSFHCGQILALMMLRGGGVAKGRDECRNAVVRRPSGTLQRENLSASEGSSDQVEKGFGPRDVLCHFLLVLGQEGDSSEEAQPMEGGRIVADGILIVELMKGVHLEGPRFARFRRVEDRRPFRVSRREGRQEGPGFLAMMGQDLVSAEEEASAPDPHENDGGEEGQEPAKGAPAGSHVSKDGRGNKKTGAVSPRWRPFLSCLLAP